MLSIVSPASAVTPISLSCISVCADLVQVSPAGEKDDTGDKQDILFKDIVLGELVALSFVVTDSNLHFCEHV